MTSAAEIRDVNVRYHDTAAADYDAKWSIDFGPGGRRRMVSKLCNALGTGSTPHFDHALEVGAGTGYFSLNLMQAGAVAAATATDISPGMVRAIEQRAASLGHEVATACCEASDLPFADDSFDLVIGHAVLHHLPELDAAFEEFRRVLRPGGALVFCGEPSHHGHRGARLPKQVGLAAAPTWRRLMGTSPREPDTAGEREEADLESRVDVHSFSPGDLESLARRTGFGDVRVTGEELIANWFGWITRTLEATAPPGDLPRSWYLFAMRSYLLLERLDRRLLEPRLPPALFYNLLLSARAPTPLATCSSPRSAPRDARGGG